MKTEKQKQALLKVNKAKRLSTKEWIAKAKEIHGDRFDYSVTVYSTAKTKLKIICPTHGEQEMLPHHHIKGNGCGKCGKAQINVSNGRQLSQEQFIERIKHIEGLSFEKTVYKNKRSDVTITCVHHGDYTTKAEIVLKGHGCPKCWGSKGEETVEQWLKEKELFYTTQQTFEGCSYQRKLKFDFYLPHLNMCIEYDGKQHFEAVEYWGGEEGLKTRKIKDQIKTNFCEEKGIKLVRITYLCNIEETLKKNIKVN